MRRRTPRTVLAAALAAAATVTLASCSPSAIGEPVADVSLSSGSLDGSSAGGAVPAGDSLQLTGGELAAARAGLDSLPVKGKAPATGYTRDQFGPAWTDNVDGVDGAGNGCDTRNDILARDLVNPVYRDGDDCIIESGTLHDPYTGTSIDFVRGVGTSSDVQIDHAVALKNAWLTGAQQLTDAQRRALANDPRNLYASDGPTNAAKGASDAASWLPPNTAFRCRYVATQITVKTIYHLWVTQPEQDAMHRVLDTCTTK